jgi:microcystin-dependent protein
LFEAAIPRKVVAALNVKGHSVQYTIGQVEIFAFDFAPVGFAACNGQLLPIMQNQALFSLLGTRYGGNGVTDFALPKLAPVAPQGPFYFICVQGGNEPRRA